MKEFLIEIAVAVAVTVATIVSKYLIDWLKTKITETKAKTNNETEHRILDEVNEAISDSVLCVSQVFVEALKKENLFTKEKQKEALEMALNKTIDSLSKEATEFITETYGDLTKWLVTKIEAQVKLSKVV